MVMFLLSTFSSPVPAFDMEQTLPRLVIHSFCASNQIAIFELKHRKRMVKRQTCFIFEYMPIILAANPSVLKAMYAWEYTFSLLSLQI